MKMICSHFMLEWLNFCAPSSLSMWSAPMAEIWCFCLNIVPVTNICTLLIKHLNTIGGALWIFSGFENVYIHMNVLIPEKEGFWVGSVSIYYWSFAKAITQLESSDNCSHCYPLHYHHPFAHVYAPLINTISLAMKILLGKITPSAVLIVFHPLLILVPPPTVPVKLHFWLMMVCEHLLPLRLLMVSPRKGTCSCSLSSEWSGGMVHMLVLSWDAFLWGVGRGCGGIVLAPPRQSAVFIRRSSW
jgi:hypothetical protein